MILSFLHAHTKLIGLMLWMVPTVLMFRTLIKHSTIREYDYFSERLAIGLILFLMSIGWVLTGPMLIIENWKEIRYQFINRDRIKRERHADKYL